MRISCFAVIVTLLAAAPLGSAEASMYKCVEEGNKIVYQDSPCPPGKELRNFDTDPAEVSVIPHEEFTQGQSKPAPARVGRTPATSKTEKKMLAPRGDAAQRKFISSGMTEAEVLAKIGKPEMTSGEKGRKSSRWSYLPTDGDPQTITSVEFNFGKVVSVERSVVQ